MREGKEPEPASEGATAIVRNVTQNFQEVHGLRGNSGNGVFLCYVHDFLLMGQELDELRGVFLLGTVGLTTWLKGGGLVSQGRRGA